MGYTWDVCVTLHGGSPDRAGVEEYARTSYLADLFGEERLAAVEAREGVVLLHAYSGGGVERADEAMTLLDRFVTLMGWDVLDSARQYFLKGDR